MVLGARRCGLGGALMRLDLWVLCWFRSEHLWFSSSDLADGPRLSTLFMSAADGAITLISHFGHVPCPGKTSVDYVTIRPMTPPLHCACSTIILFWTTLGKSVQIILHRVSIFGERA